MVFSSPWFFLFVIALLAVLALPLGLATKKRLLALASCFFYAVWDVRYVALLLAISVVDYICAARISAAPTGDPARRRWLIASMVSNLLVLAYFKYTNFFIDNVNGVLRASGLEPWPYLNILLPAGVSFYTFKTMSYVIDVWRREIQPCRSWLDYATFITFFPELIAGPIVRASVFLPQMERPIGPTRRQLREAASLFLVGLTKKLMADRLGSMVSPVFASPGLFESSTLWAAALGYSLQIYCDFSGYSDMAIGTAKAIGYDLPENFRMPYLSPNVSQFWRRWHMTLSSWLRDYLYIPLGGNRQGSAYRNLLLTMMLGGLWHGASWNFVLWGTLHGLALGVHRLYKHLTGERQLLPEPLAVAGTFLFVTLCWIPFRCQTFGATRAMLQGLFGMGSGTVSWVSIDLAVMTTVVVFGHLMGLAVERQLHRPAQAPPGPVARLLGWFSAEIRENPVSGPQIVLGFRSAAGASLVLTWILLAFLLSAKASNPFIYFQF